MEHTMHGQSSGFEVERHAVKGRLPTGLVHADVDFSFHRAMRRFGQVKTEDVGGAAKTHEGAVKAGHFTIAHQNEVNEGDAAADAPRCSPRTLEQEAAPHPYAGHSGKDGELRRALRLEAEAAARFRRLPRSGRSVPADGHGNPHKPR